jgi:two-component system sensor histidine kinase EvgS
MSVLQNSTEKAIQKRIYTVSSLFSAMAKDSMISYDLATLNTYVNEIIKHPDMVYIRVLDQNSNLLSSANRQEGLTRVFKRDESIGDVTDGVFDTSSDITELTSNFGRIEFGLDVDFARKDAAEAQSILLFISFIAIGATVLFTFILGKYLTRQLTALAQASKALSEGDLNYRVNVSPGKDELTKTAISFNEMADKLNTLYLDVQHEASFNRAIFSTSPSGIIILDSKGIFKQLNPETETLFNVQADQHIGKNIDTLIYSTSEENNYFFNTSIKSNGQLTNEAWAIRHDQSRFPIYLAVGKMTLTDDTMYVVIVSDLTERKQHEEELEKYRENLEITVKKRTEELELARDSAEAGARTKAAFLANMSHEIRTPMNSIIGFTEMLILKHELPEGSLKHLKTVLNSAQSLLVIINDILDISKLESGKFALEKVYFHLPNALILALQTVNQQALNKGLEIKLEIEPSLPQRYLGDPTRLRQVILNLVSNSIKFTKEGYIHISVSLETHNKLHFIIRDTGIGMSEQQVDNVFESFVQADESTTRCFGGTGLGTTISKQIVTIMGGDIWVKSQLGEGSEFHFTCLFDIAEQPLDQECLFENDLQALDQYISPRKFNVLLTEDIEANAELASLRLEQQGHKVHWVKNGKEAVDATQENTYDIILMDVMMPVMDGFEASREIRRNELGTNNHIQILALTASVMTEDHVNCIKSGMDGVEAKPINFNHLFSTMEKLIPKELGEINNTYEIEEQKQAHIDFSPLNNIVNYDKAIEVWRDENIYVRALIKFSKQRREDATQMAQLLQDQDNLKPAKALAHSLKGLAGNLYITQVAELVTVIDANITSGHQENVTAELIDLKQALQLACDAISTLDISKNSQEAPVEYDEEAIKSQLGDLIIALNTLDPDVIEPLLIKLTDSIGKAALDEVQEEVDAFNFENAILHTQKVAVNLGISLEY